MRLLEEWDETDLEALISNGVQEGLRLDYKQSESLARTDKAKAELAKDVSAFANSAGGRIIYGIVEADQLPVAIDKGADPSVISREWVEQVINSQISPRVSGIIIKPIQLQTGGNAYVIEIPQATTFAPHQANHRYFRRFNFQSVPMEDYEVKDAMRRSSIGDPYLRFSWTQSAPATDGSPRARLRIVAGNRASEPIFYAHVEIYIDQRISQISEYTGWTALEGVNFNVGLDKPLPAIGFYKNFLPSNHMPFFKETEWPMFDLIVQIPPRGEYVFGYLFSAAGVSRQHTEAFLIDEYHVIPVSETGELLHAGLRSK